MDRYKRLYARLRREGLPARLERGQFLEHIEEIWQALHAQEETLPPTLRNYYASLTALRTTLWDEGTDDDM